MDIFHLLDKENRSICKVDVRVRAYTGQPAQYSIWRYIAPGRNYCRLRICAFQMFYERPDSVSKIDSINNWARLWLGLKGGYGTS